MRLLIVLPRETAILAKRRAIDGEKNQPIMHALDSDVFNYLCMHTDWASGKIGLQSKISYSGIALALTEDIPRKPTRSLRTIKRKCVYNSVQRLIKADLFVSESIAEKGNNALILSRFFWQVLLATHFSSKNTDSQQLAGCMREVFGSNAMNYKHLEESIGDEKSDRYYPVGTYKSNNLSNRKSVAFRLPLTWQYDEKLVELFLQPAGFSASQIKQIWFGKYVQYWSGRDVTRTQQEWSAHFSNHMQSYLLRPHFFEKVNGMLGYLDDATTPKSNAKRKCKGKKLTVPLLKDGTQLQAWAMANDLPDAPVGASTTQYYQLLCHALETGKCKA